MREIERVYNFLNEVGVYYLATVDGDQPHVRAFGAILLYDDRIYIMTGKKKDVSKQIASNAKFEICAFKDGKWLRIAGELVDDDRRELKVAMLEKVPELKAMYDPDDGNMQMLYIKNAKATFSSFVHEAETVEL